VALLTHAGRSFALERSIVTIGTAADADVVVASPHCSRKHALVLRDGDGWLLVDFRSANGVAVNGRPIELQRLRDGDAITLSGATGAAEVRLEFRSGSSAPTSPTPRASAREPTTALALARISRALAAHATRTEILHAVLDTLLDLTAADRAVLALVGPWRVEDTRAPGRAAASRERTSGGIVDSSWSLWAPAAAAVCAGTPVLFSSECGSDPRLETVVADDRRARAIPMILSGLWASLDAGGSRYGVLQLDTRFGSKTLAPVAEEIVKATRGTLALGLAALHAREKS
jgi:pSer/pThr/pTyr-binding forkhead associated (FHA) protein